MIKKEYNTIEENFLNEIIKIIKSFPDYNLIVKENLNLESIPGKIKSLYYSIDNEILEYGKFLDEETDSYFYKLINYVFINGLYTYNHLCNESSCLNDLTDIMEQNKINTNKEINSQAIDGSSNSNYYYDYLFTRYINQTKINELRKEKFKKGSSKYINVNYIFTEGKRDYMVENIINKVHNNYISALTELNNNRILTSCRKDYLMKIFEEDEEGNVYKEVKQIKGTCGCLIYFKEKNKIFSGGADGVISIFEERKNNEYSKIMTLSSHDKPINTMAKISDDKIVSGGADCRLIIWKLSELDSQFYNVQTIYVKYIKFKNSIYSSFIFIWRG